MENVVSPQTAVVLALLAAMFKLWESVPSVKDAKLRWPAYLSALFGTCSALLVAILQFVPEVVDQEDLQDLVVSGSISLGVAIVIPVCLLASSMRGKPKIDPEDDSLIAQTASDGIHDTVLELTSRGVPRPTALAAVRTALPDLK